MNTIEIGDLAVTMITASFLRLRYVVLRPVSERHRFDLVIDRGNGFERVQCKSGRLRKGCVVFQACSLRGRKRLGYRGQIELFGVYCEANGKVYLVPVGDVPESDGWLRVSMAKNRQVKGIRMARDYELPVAIVPESYSESN